MCSSDLGGSGGRDTGFGSNALFYLSVYLDASRNFMPPEGKACVSFKVSPKGKRLTYDVRSLYVDPLDLTFPSDLEMGVEEGRLDRGRVIDHLII